MANTSLAVLESALRTRKLDRTLITALPSLERTDASTLLPTEIAALDACLRGGIPRGQLSEISGPGSSGRMTLLLQIFAASTRRGELTALVDTFDRCDVTSVGSAGVDVSRLLWIRGHAISNTTAVVNTCERILDRALKALNLVLQAGGYSVVAIDLADVPPRALKRLPYTTWLRVQRAVEGSDTACVLVVPEPLARSAGGLTLALKGRTQWHGDSSRSRRLTGLDVTVRIVSPRRCVDGEAHVWCGVRS